MPAIMGFPTLDEKLQSQKCGPGKTEFNLWTISPTVTVEFQFQTGEKAWNSEASMGLGRRVGAISVFARDGQVLDLTVVF